LTREAKHRGKANPEVRAKHSDRSDCSQRPARWRWLVVHAATQSSGVRAGQVSASNVQASVASLPVASSPSQPQGTHCAANPPPNRIRRCHQYCRPIQSGGAHQHFRQSNSGPATLTAVRAGASAETAHNPQLSRIRKRRSSATTSAVAQPAAETCRRSLSLGSSSRQTQGLPSRSAPNGAEPDAGIALNNDAQPESSHKHSTPDWRQQQSAFGTRSHRFPLEETPNRQNWIFFRAPVYPALPEPACFGQRPHRRIDRCHGHVTTMKVVSGPSLLHQAAMTL